MTRPKSGSAVVDVFESARQATWEAWWKHVTRRGDARRAEELWREYELAVHATDGEITTRHALQLELARNAAVADAGPAADLGLADACASAGAA